jgi:hypothetical protein
VVIDSGAKRPISSFLPANHWHTSSLSPECFTVITGPPDLSTTWSPIEKGIGVEGALVILNPHVLLLKYQHKHEVYKTKNQPVKGIIF